jgi:hypothetical protein
MVGHKVGDSTDEDRVVVHTLGSRKVHTKLLVNKMR